MVVVTSPAAPSHDQAAAPLPSARSKAATIAPTGAMFMTTMVAGRPQNAVRFGMQAALSTAIVLLAWLTFRPAHFPGGWAVTFTLLVINSVLAFYRLVPVDRFSPRVDLAAMTIWGIAAAILLGIASVSGAPAFGYMACGHIGYRLKARAGVALSVMSGAVAAATLLVIHPVDADSWPWLLGFTITFTAFVGVANRSNDNAVRSALDAAEAARRASASEARAQTLAERARISRDVHDVLAHSLSGVNMQLELTDALLEDGHIDKARASLQTAQSLVREGMAETRRAVQASRAEVLPLAKTLRAMFGAPNSFSIAGAERELPTEMSQTLVRVAQESLTNARRHAPGAMVQAELTFAVGLVRLEVANGPGGDGAGAGHEGSGMGLVGMRERVQLLDGTVEAGPVVEGRLAGGWRVVVQLPV